MKRLQLYIRALFGFSRMETNGFLILLPMVIIILFSEPMYRALVPPTPLGDLDRTDSLIAWMDDQEKIVARQRFDTIVFRFFDPNEISHEELIDLGLKEPIAGRLIRYREKGGRFRNREAVEKIYGMDTAWYRRAQAWMKFTLPDPPKIKTTLRSKAILRDDLNTADTLQFQDVYGIGPALARRIVRFRDRLGGYIAGDQLRDVYGLDSVVIQRVMRQFEIKPGFEPRKINLATATIEELLQHPYVKRKQAHAIVAYRSQHGLASPEQLRQIPSLEESWINKMLPYLQAPLPFK